MSYSEWAINNWQNSATYRKAVANVQRLKLEILKLEESIVLAERGETPKVNDYMFQKEQGGLGLSLDIGAITQAMFRSVLGVPQEPQVDRWEREAVEAQEAHREKLDNWLRLYRDGDNVLAKYVEEGESKFGFGSLPYLKDELLKAEHQLDNCVPESPYDWKGLIVTDNRYDDDDEGNTIWYDNSRRLLVDMLDTLGITSDHDFNDELANFIQDIAGGGDGFRFSFWSDEFGSFTCTIHHCSDNNLHSSAHGMNLWDAVLQAMLSYIETNWENLLAYFDDLYGLPSPH